MSAHPAGAAARETALDPTFLFSRFNVWLTLELTNLCNLRCTMCEVRRHDPLPQGFMDPDLFAGILGDLERRGLACHGLKLFWLGEPLLHPAFPDLLAAIPPRAVNGTVVFDTNCLHLDEAVCEAIVERCRDCKVYLFLSLDAVSDATYARMRVGGERARAYANVHRLLSLRAARGRAFPKVRLQFIVHRENRGEAAAFVDYWRSQPYFPGGLPIMDAVQDDRDFIHIRRWIAAPGEQAEADRLYDETLAELGVARAAMPANVDARACDASDFPCEHLFAMPMVRWTGDVTVCNNDLELALRVGSARETPFVDLWCGPAVSALRAAHLGGGRGSLAKCAACRAAGRPYFPAAMAEAAASLGAAPPGADEGAPR